MLRPKSVLLLLVVGGLVFVGGFIIAAISNHPTPASYSDGTKISGNFTGSFADGNYVYGGAMNLAWNDLSKNIIGGPIVLNTTDQAALQMTSALNKSIFTKDDLDEGSYYIKSGYGQKTLETINRESRQKFPSKSFADLDFSLSDDDIIAYAYFLKEVEYPVAFKEREVSFEGNDGSSNAVDVKGFYAGSSEQKDNVQVLKYWSDDKFIISLKLKDENDRLLVAKGFSMDDPEIVVGEINNNNVSNLQAISENDMFEMPKLQLDYHRDYSEVLYKNLANSGFEDYSFSIMFENIKFDLDQKGARVENEAVIVATYGLSADNKPPQIRRFILDKPFWVVMQRKNSQHPYFVLGINNTALMEKE